MCSAWWWASFEVRRDGIRPSCVAVCRWHRLRIWHVYAPLVEAAVQYFVPPSPRARSRFNNNALWRADVFAYIEV